MANKFIRKFFRKRNELPYGKCFVSHSYEDTPVLEYIRKHIGGEVNLIVFPALSLPPEQMVSNDLIEAIRNCDSLIYIKGGASDQSPWVTLERNYALQSNIDVYYFDKKSESIGRDTSSPLYLPVYASYLKTDGTRVSEIVDFMARERSFDINMDEKIPAGSNIGQTLENAIFSRLERGGYVVFFWSEEAAKSEWVLAETQLAHGKYSNRILLALMDPVELPPMLQDIVPVQLYRENSKDIDKRRLDDLIVRLYWLIQQNSRGGISVT